MNKSQRHLRSAKLFGLAAFLFALGSVLECIAGSRGVGLMFGSLTFLYGCFAFSQYSLSRKADDGSA